MKRRCFKENKGITLIALVVTIVVLIILATISINAVLGENGIIGKAEKAKMIQSHGEVTEAIKLAYVDYEFEQMTGETAKIEETKLASVETGIKLAATNNETFLEYLIRKGYTDENGVVNVENLLGNSTGVGNGSGNTDVYKIEETDDGKYELNYYDKEEDKTKLTEINKNGEIVEVGKEPEKYAYSFKAGDDITAYVIEIEEKSTEEEKIYEVLFRGKGEMYSTATSWEAPGVVGAIEGGEGGVFVKWYEKIEKVKIEEGITNISDQAFRCCHDLTSVEISDSVTSIGYDAFWGTAWENAQPDGDVYAGKVYYTYKGTMPENTSITIKEGTKGIADFAFDGCSNLTSIEIPDSVTNIGDDAFYGCSSLTTVNYRGTEEQWNAIEISSSGNDPLTSATKNYNYAGE